MRLLLSVFVMMILSGCDDHSMTINQLQFVGSHNSYKLAMDIDMVTVLTERSPEAVESLDYSHLPIPDQLDMGLRKLELDVFFDAKTNMLSVGHVQQIDMNSSCSPLISCFNQILAWSKINPTHVPIWISFNAKDQVIDGLPVPDSFSDQALALLDTQIEQSFEGKLIWPKDVVGLNWPRIDQAWGKFLFVLDEAGLKQERYLIDWDSRPMFTTVEPPHPAAAILIVNDPVKNQTSIRDLVDRGYMVRTRADADTREARFNETGRKLAAMSSGAQAISTDYYVPSTHFDSAYQLEPFIRCNPINTSSLCSFYE